MADTTRQPEGTDAASADAQWTVEQRRTFRDQLDRRRARQLRAGQIFGAILILIVAACVVLRLSTALWVPAVGAIALLGTVFRLANWKCPNCGERLPSRRLSPICLGCGAPLQ